MKWLWLSPLGDDGAALAETTGAVESQLNSKRNHQRMKTAARRLYADGLTTSGRSFSRFMQGFIERHAERP